MTKFRERLLAIGQAVLGFYMFIAFVLCVPYCNWRYANDHGVVKWIFFGEVIATVEALGWPYTVVYKGRVEKGTRKAFIAAMVNAHKGAEHSSSLSSKEGNALVGTMSEEELQQWIDYNKAALEEIQKADIDALNRLYPELGTHIRDDFIPSIKERLKGFAATTVEDSFNHQLVAAEAEERWLDWYHVHFEAIKISL